MAEWLMWVALFAAGYGLRAWLGRLRHLRVSRAERRTSGALRSASEMIRYAARQDSFFNMVLGYIPCQVFIKDPMDGFRYKVANRNFTEYYQLNESDVVEHPDEDIFEPDVARQLRAHDREVCANPGKVFRYDEDISYRRRGKEVFKSLKVCFETADHHPYMLGVCVDITDLDSMIRMERVNNEALSRAVAETDFGKVVAASALTLQKELGCDRVAFLNCDAEGRLKLFHEACVAGFPPSAKTGLEYLEKLWNAHLSRLETDALIFYERFEDIPNAKEFLAAHPDYPTRSIAAVPIFVKDRLLGAVLVSYCVPHRFRETDKGLLHSMGKIVSLAAIRDRQSRSMRQAEEENQALLDNISIPLWLYDTKGCVIQTNRAADRLFGVADGAKPFDCCRLLQCGDATETCSVRRVLKTCETARERRRFGDKSYLVESNPILDAKNGAVHGVVSSFYDVTELEEAISCRQSVNDCLTTMARENDVRSAMHASIRDICEHLKASRCYIMQFDGEGKKVSRFLEYAHGAASPDLPTQERATAPRTDWRAHFRETPLLSFPNRAALDNIDGLTPRCDGRESCDAQSVYAHRILLNGALWGFVGALYERTPHALTAAEDDYLGSIAYCIELMLLRQQYQGEILDALRKAEDADKAKSMFLASMSHEIRTPLNAVIGLSELLKDDTLPNPTRTEYLGAVSNAGNALLALINDVLDLSKLEAGQMVFTPTDIDFAVLVGEVGNIFLQNCRKKGLALQTRVASDIPLVVLDKLRVRQILFNLLGNAVKFTESGSITVKARFEKRTERCGTLEFAVADTGIGISEDDQKRLFQLFVQGKALRGTQTERNGTGLGLAICRRMVEKMNGKLLLKSELGKGSEFIVTLNDVPWIERAVAAVRESAPEAAREVGAITVLVADDVSMNLKVMRAMLGKLGAGVTVLTASNADEALETLKNNAVDFLLTDLWMPGMNGAELAMKIRRSGDYPDLVIAAVTADVDGCENFDMSKFDMMLTKPITIEKLRHLIERYCNASASDAATADAP